MGRSSRSGRVVVLATAVLLMLSIAACSGNEDEQTKAADTLAAALQAHQDGRLDDAVELYKEVVALDPDNKFAYYNLALIHQSRGANSLAEGEYRGVLAIDPEFVPALFNLAILKTARDEPDEAVDLYERVIEVRPDYAAAHLNLGFLLLATGHRQEGKAELQRAVDLDPSLASRIPEKIAADLEPPASLGPTTATSFPSPSA
jgi:tetratricopeptide (TPR) repeat protein